MEGRPVRAKRPNRFRGAPTVLHALSLLAWIAAGVGCAGHTFGANGAGDASPSGAAATPASPADPIATDTNQTPNPSPSATNGNAANGAVAPVGDAFVGGPGSQAFANGFGCTARLQGAGATADLVLTSTKDGVVTTSYTVGAGGALTAVRNADGRNVLGPAICADLNNEVDRISQWTCWDMQPDPNGLVQPGSCGGGDCRFNVTQAGRGDCSNQYTHSFSIDANSCQIDVYSYHPLQWNPSNQSYFGGVGIAAHTRLSVPYADGTVRVRRAVLLPPTTAGGKATAFAQFYFEQWTALAQASFPYGIYSYDPISGAPNWFYQSGSGGNMPSYAGQLASATAGYVSAASAAVAGAKTLALVVGQESPCLYGADGSCTALAGAVTWANLLDATGSGVVALLPAVHLDHVGVTNAIVEQTLDLVSWPAAPVAAHAFLSSKAATVPRPRIVPAGLTPPEDAEVVAKLRQLAVQGTAGATQVGHLGALSQ